MDSSTSSSPTACPDLVREYAEGGSSTDSLDCADISIYLGKNNFFAWPLFEGPSELGRPMGHYGCSTFLSLFTSMNDAHEMEKMSL